MVGRAIWLQKGKSQSCNDKGGGQMRDRADKGSDMGNMPL